MFKKPTFAVFSNTGQSFQRYCYLNNAVNVARATSRNGIDKFIMCYENGRGEIFHYRNGEIINYCVIGA